LIKNQTFFKGLAAGTLLLFFLSLEHQANTETKARQPHGNPTRSQEALTKVEAIYRSHPQQALRILDSLGPASRLTHHQRGTWHLLKAKCYQRQNKYQGSIEEALLAETALAKTNDSSGLLGCYSIKGNAYFHLLALEASAEFYQKAMHLALALGRTDAVADLTLNLGNIYAQQKDWNKAHTYYQDALTYFQKNQDPMASYVLNNLGVVEEMNGRFRVAQNYYTQALQIDTKLKDSMAIASDLINLGEVNLKLRQCGESMQCLQQSLRISKLLDNGGFVSKILMLRAEGHLQCGGRRDSAIAYAREVIRWVQRGQSEDTLNLRKAHALLASQLTAAGLASEAIVHYQNWRELDSLIQAREAQVKLMEIQATYDSEHLQRKSERLEFEKILLQTRSERLHATNLALASALLLGVAITALLYFRRKALRAEEFDED
jgi:tetratricopeptide (TPR) repeat protein